jgi:SAM-dependent methyltransferase
MLEEFRKHGAHVHGIEPSTAACRFCKDRLKIDVRQGTCDDVRASEAYDIVVLNNVIEHVCNPVRVLEMSASMLRSGGIVFISTPNLSAGERLGSAWRGFSVDSEHLFYFSANVLRMVLPRFSLGVRDVEYAPFTIGLGGRSSRLKADVITQRLRSVIYRVPVLASLGFGAVKWIRRVRNRQTITSGQADQILVIAG